MKFGWIPYTSEYSQIAESFLDDDAKRITGIDDGWDDYISYWVNEPSVHYGEDFFAFVIFLSDEPIGVIAVGFHEEILSVPEIIIAPEKRGKGYGSSILSELLTYGGRIMGRESLVINTASAVIFPKNTASKRAFEKAGFVCESSHPDGDADYYVFKRKMP